MNGMLRHQAENDNLHVHVLLIHGADRLHFEQDLQEAAKRGIIGHAPDLPVYSGHPVDGVHEYYELLSDFLALEVGKIKAATPEAKIAAIGRNLGGSQLAYHASRHDCFQAVVLTGAIPDLSRFKARAAHAGAEAYRKALGTADPVMCFERLANLDILSTLPLMRCANCLLQAGLSDPWLDQQSFKVFNALADAGHLVEYENDDHAMNTTQSLQRRWDFIEKTIRAGGQEPVRVGTSGSTGL